MYRKTNSLLVLSASLLMGAIGVAQTVAPYPKMAPLDQYLMPAAQEIALARSAAPKTIADHAQIMVLGRGGFTVAVPGANGFVCMVERSWSGPDDAQFWNPKIRGPVCLNPAAVRTYLPITQMKTKLVLGGSSRDAMFHSVTAVAKARRLPAVEPGAMSFMLSRQQYVGEPGRQWHPHLMFFVPLGQKWGENLAGSPVVASDEPEDQLTLMMVPVARWSDGTPAAPLGQP